MYGRDMILEILSIFYTAVHIAMMKNKEFLLPLFRSSKVGAGKGPIMAAMKTFLHPERN